MNPLTEQKVHLAGNPIKSQGEVLFCLLLIIASLPCTVAAALLLLVQWDGGEGGDGGELGIWGQRDGGDLLTMHTALARYTACTTSVRERDTKTLSPSFSF